MRDLFPEYNKPNQTEFKKLWEEALFVLDANVLLSLYRFPQKTRKELLTTFEKIKDRLWIPNQVALEYYRNRNEVIYSQEKAYGDMLLILEKNEEDVRKSIENKHLKHPFIDCKRILKKITSNYKAIKAEMDKLKSKHPDWSKKDAIEEQINSLFKNKVGIPYDIKKVNEIYVIGQDRYRKEVPPGYMDENKNETRKYGDLIIWFQIIDKAKEINKPIIFVTDERKEDWWWRVGGKTGKTIGAKHELIKEMKESAGVAFHMYQTDRFMEYAAQYLGIKPDKEMIEQIKQSRKAAMKEEEGLAGSGQGISVSSNDLTSAGTASTIPPPQINGLTDATSSANSGDNSGLSSEAGAGNEDSAQKKQSL